MPMRTVGLFGVLRLAALVALAAVVGLACTPQRWTHTGYHPDGTVRWTMETIQGLPHGATVSYHPNGQVAWTGRFADGSRHGIFEYRDDDGGLVRRDAYVEGRLVWEGTGPDYVPPIDLKIPEPVEPLLPGPGEMQPAFSTMDLSRTSTAMDVQLVHTRFTEGGEGHLVHLFGQYQPARWGGYAQFVGGQLDSSGEASTLSKMVGEAGATYEWPLRDTTMVLRAGAFAPLAADDTAGFRAAAQMSYGRLTDVAMTFPRTAGGRGSASLVGSYGMGVYRADLGVDALVDIGSGDRHPRLDSSWALLARANVAGGLRFGDVAMSVEFVSVGMVTAPRERQERFAHGAAGSVALLGRRVAACGAVSTPLDLRARGKALAVLLGVGLSRH
jgi:hypothetical protein